MPLPLIASKQYKTTVNNQKIVKVGIFADVENGKKELQTMGFYTIDGDLPTGSEIVFDISLGIDEVFEIKVHPKSDKSKNKKIVLGRGNKDSKALEFLLGCIEKMLGNGFSEKQKDYFFKAAKKEIDKINSLVVESNDSDKWEEIGTSTFSAFEQAERVSDSIDEDEFAIIFAQILIGEYPNLIMSEDATEMRRLLHDIKHGDDALQKIQSSQKLKSLTDDYPVLITLFTVKMASDTAAKTNPSDAHRLLQMHEQIKTHFRNRRKDEAYALLTEAIELRDMYDEGGIDISSIHLKK
jgi:molecular chaperone DnaK